MSAAGGGCAGCVMSQHAALVQMLTVCYHYRYALVVMHDKCLYVSTRTSYYTESVLPHYK